MITETPIIIVSKKQFEMLMEEGTLWKRDGKFYYKSL